jgi:hypothetical protein
MRAITLAGEAPLLVYDTSGPYTEAEATIDIAAGLAPLRQSWIAARGDTDICPPRRLEARGQRVMVRAKRRRFPPSGPPAGRCVGQRQDGP